MGRKEKLEAGLEDLFSTSKKPKKRARPKPAATKAEAPAPEQAGVEQPEAASPAPEQPVAAVPTAEVREMATETPQPERPGTRIATDRHEEQLVVFTLANEHYGVDIAAVESIIKLQPITSVPQTPAFVEGLTNLRGTVLPVIDLRKRFELSAEEATKETRIVVAEVNGETVGMVVDAVTEVLRVPEEDIEPPSPVVTTAASAFITGIAKVDERLIILLELGQVLSTEEQVDLQSFQQQAQDETLPAEE